MRPQQVLDLLAGGLVVSCQAYPGEPMRSTTVMRAVAETVVLAGADGVRLQGVDDIKAVKARLDVPILGLIKRGNAGVFITPTLRDVQAVCEAGADIVAIDGTERPRPDGSPLKGSIDLAHDMGKTVMADCSSVEDAQYCEANGVDIVSTTLAGYREGQHKTTGPDIGFIHDLRRSLRTPIFAEGRIGTPEEARACFEAGAVTVVVGTAITHPGRITQRFVDALGRR